MARDENGCISKAPLDSPGPAPTPRQRPLTLPLYLSFLPRQGISLDE